MRVFSDVSQVQKHCLSLKRRGVTIGFVPTMGALHDGHLSLVRRARKENACVCVSIFVNPIQFGPAEDLKRYPRPIRRDTSLCRKEKADVLFVPTVHGLYGNDFRTYVEVKGLSDVLCGATRHGHFRGVATVLAKLFNIIQPDRAYFGQKDFQQTVVVRRMAAELNFPVDIRVLPTVRGKDGLAMSSRNAYLSPAEHADALRLSQSLQLARDMVKEGQRDPRAIIRRMERLIKEGGLGAEYIEIVDPDTLVPLRRINGRAAVVIAARAGRTRLIDNAIIGG